MKKYDLLQSGDSIIRVLEVQGDRVLVIDCIQENDARVDRNNGSGILLRVYH